MNFQFWKSKAENFRFELLPVLSKHHVVNHIPGAGLLKGPSKYRWLQGWLSNTVVWMTQPRKCCFHCWERVLICFSCTFFKIFSSKVKFEIERFWNLKSSASKCECSLKSKSSKVELLSTLKNYGCASKTVSSRKLAAEAAPEESFECFWILCQIKN